MTDLARVVQVVPTSLNFLHLSAGTLYQWAYQRRIPTVKLFGGALRFRLSTLEKLIAKWERPAVRSLGDGE
jgi:hypothetical protein